MTKYYCPVKGGQELSKEELELHHCLHLQRKNKNRRTRKKEYFRCPRLIVV